MLALPMWVVLWTALDRVGMLAFTGMPALPTALDRVGMLAGLLRADNFSPPLRSMQCHLLPLVCAENFETRSHRVLSSAHVTPSLHSQRVMCVVGGVECIRGYIRPAPILLNPPRGMLSSRVSAY